MAARKRGGSAPPPKLALALIRWLSPEELRESITGDVIERFHSISSSRGSLIARLRIWKQALLMRPWKLRKALQSAHLRSPRLSPRGSSMPQFGSDLLHSIRSIRHRGISSAVIIATVAIAITATTTIFSVVDGVLLRPLPYPESDQVVQIWQTHDEWADSPNQQLRDFAQHFPVSLPRVQDWENETREFSSIGAYSSLSFRYSGPEYVEVVRGLMVTSGIFATLNQPPLVGRTLGPDDDLPGAPPVVVLGHAFWMDRMEGDPDVVGNSVTLNGVPHTVVGVMPREFYFPRERTQLWTSIPEREKVEAERDSQFLLTIGRLSAGSSLPVATTDLERIQERIKEAYPEAQEDFGIRLEPMIDSVVGDIRSTLLFLLASTALVLLVACVNISNMLTVQGVTRRRELSVRSALGASSRQLIRGLMIESGLLAAIGGLIGTVMTLLAVPLLLSLLQDSIPRLHEVGVDPRILLFGLAVSLVTALIVGILPGVQAGRTDPADAMNASSRGAIGNLFASRLRSTLVIAEVALAFILLAGAGLLSTSYLKLTGVDRGFDTRRLVLLETMPTEYEDSIPAGFLEQLQPIIEAVPGIVGATASNQVPLSGSISVSGYFFEREGGEEEEVNVIINAVLPNYFDVVGIPLQQGRVFDRTDVSEGTPVGIVSRTLSDLIWPGSDPIGRRLRPGERADWITVVGVVDDVHHQGLGVPIEPKLYVPSTQSRRATSSWIIRSETPAGDALRAVQAAIRQNLPQTAFTRAEILEETVSQSVAVPRIRTVLLLGMALIAALLAILGVYGVVSFSVSQRTREIGVRMALGAQKGAVLGGIVKSGIVMALIGVLVGLVVALPLTGLISDFLFGTAPKNPLIFLGIGLLVVGVSAAASIPPARRAARVDPMSILNSS